MRHIGLAPSLLPTLPRLSALLVCVALLAGCRFGAPVSFLVEDGAIEKAVTTLRQRMDPPARVLNIVVTPFQVAVRAQDPKNRNRVEEWRLERVHRAGISWERVSGPWPYELTLVNPDLESNLFELDEIDFAAAGGLVRAAVEFAGLPGKPTVTRMELARQAFVVPVPASGEVRWTVDIMSDRESVQVFADAAGAIVGTNIDGTERARNLDILRELDLVAEAARAVRFILGRDTPLTNVSIGARSIGFETAAPESDRRAARAALPRRLYVWNLNGLQRASPPQASAAARPATFSVDDVEWTLLPKIVVAARTELAMPQGRITAIEVARPPSALGPPIVLWRIEITDQNQEKGVVDFDVGGTVRQAIPPQSRRKSIDWFDPKIISETLTRLAAQMGRDRQFAEIAFRADKVVITAQDPMQLNSFTQVLLTDIGFEAASTTAPGPTKAIPFKIFDLQPLTVARLSDLERRTLAALKMPTKSIAGITIGRDNSEPSPRGNITIEIQAEDKASGRAGRIVYELDGTMLHAFLP